MTPPIFIPQTARAPRREHNAPALGRAAVRYWIIPLRAKDNERERAHYSANTACGLMTKHRKFCVVQNKKRGFLPFGCLRHSEHGCALHKICVLYNSRVKQGGARSVPPRVFVSVRQSTTATCEAIGARCWTVRAAEPKGQLRSGSRGGSPPAPAAPPRGRCSRKETGVTPCFARAGVIGAG